MNSCDIAERQNEPFMLKIQYAARFCYNLAEKQNYFVWLFCFISAFSIFLPDGLPEYLPLVVPFTADIIAWILMTFVNKNVQKGADLRKYFDVYSVNISTDQYSESEKRRPPGVHDWYMFSKQYNGLEAKFECQRQNTWWDKKLFPIKCAVTALVFGIAVIVFVTVAIWNGFFKTLLCSAGLLTKLFERVVDNGKYCILSIKIDGAQQTLEAHLTIEGVEQLQALINERRAVNILGINLLHKKLANKLTKKYNNISSS